MMRWKGHWMWELKPLEDIETPNGSKWPIMWSFVAWWGHRTLRWFDGPRSHLMTTRWWFWSPWRWSDKAWDPCTWWYVGMVIPLHLVALAWMNVAFVIFEGVLTAVILMMEPLCHLEPLKCLKLLQPEQIWWWHGKHILNQLNDYMVEWTSSNIGV